MATYETKLSALEECLKIWTTIADNLCVSKEEAYKLLDIDQYRDKHMCPACEFSRPDEGPRDTAVNCDQCPIWKPNDEYKFTRCERDPNSPYYKWYRATTAAGIEEGAVEMIQLINIRISEERASC